jgi:hypothetical protein
VVLPLDLASTVVVRGVPSGDWIGVAPMRRAWSNHPIWVSEQGCDAWGRLARDDVGKAGGQSPVVMPHSGNSRGSHNDRDCRRAQQTVRRHPPVHGSFAPIARDGATWLAQEPCLAPVHREPVKSG